MKRNLSEKQTRVFILGVILAYMYVLPVESIEIALEQRPIFVFHGLGDSCKQMNKPFECIETGAGLFDSIADLMVQGETACNTLVKKIFDDKETVKDEFSYGFHLIGYSQGGLIVRIVFHFCPRIRKYIKRILTFGSPHLGIESLPDTWYSRLGLCIYRAYKGEEKFSKCSFNQYLTTRSAEISQNPLIVIPETSQIHLEIIPEKKSLIETLLNDVKTIDNKVESMQIYNELEGMVIVQFTKDTMVNPTSSSLFGITYDKVTKKFTKFDDKNVKESVGIAELDERGYLISCIVEADHLKFENVDQHDLLRAFLYDKHPNSEYEQNPSKKDVYSWQFYSRVNTLEEKFNCGSWKRTKKQASLI
jgi:hypothetical protein